MRSFEDLLLVHLGLGSDRIKYKLICRYWNKVSKRLQKERDAIETRAKIKGEELLKEQILNKNSLFSLVEQKEGWTGSSLIIPIKFIND